MAAIALSDKILSSLASKSKEIFQPKKNPWRLPKTSKQNLLRYLKSGKFIYRVYFYRVKYGGERVAAGIEMYRLGPGRVVLEERHAARPSSITLRCDCYQHWYCDKGIVTETPCSKTDSPLHLSTLVGYEASTFAFSWREAVRIAKLYTTNEAAIGYMNNRLLQLRDIYEKEDFHKPYHIERISRA